MTTHASHKKSTKVVHMPKKKAATTHYRFPDLTEFRKSIHVKGKPLSQIIIEGRG